MGSILSPSIARLVMDFVLDQIVPRLPFQLPFIKKYVDDIITAIPQDKIESTLHIFNDFNQHIQFTIEQETNNSVPFLDTRPIRQANGTIVVDWYQKPTNSGRYIHFHSNHPTKQKINLVLGLKNRIVKICHPTLRMANLIKLKSILKTNAYPEALLNKYLFSTPAPAGAMNERQTQIETTDARMGGVEIAPIMYFSLPFITDLTNKLASILRTDNCKIAKSNNFKIANVFSKLKDPISKDKQSNVVYSIPCAVCDLIYVGQTFQQLKQRVSQHKSDINKTNKNCALATHCRETI